jgi:4-alpha-glucanotransferase
VKLHFYLRYHTHYGESLWLTGDSFVLGNNEISRAMPMRYLDNEYWQVIVEIPLKLMPEKIRYKYLVRNKEGEIISEPVFEKFFERPQKNYREIMLHDTWNNPGEYENVFFTAPFKKVLLKSKDSKSKPGESKRTTHTLRVKAPLLKKNESVCLLGSGNTLNDWSTEEPLILRKKGDWYEIKLNLSGEQFPIEYKYGIYDTKSGQLKSFESGNNRVLYCGSVKKKTTLLHDGFIHFPNNTWKGAGVAVPVFSLKSKKSFGIGEFTDIRLLADWAQKTGIKLIQLLPINDTIASYSAADSYPYAAISAFALHPVYINLAKVAGKEYAEPIGLLKNKQKELNALPFVEFESVLKLKLAALKELYAVMKDDCLSGESFQIFFSDNADWLKPYAAFCFLRDTYGHTRFEEWPGFATYDPGQIDNLCSPDSISYYDVAFWFFVQYHLHLQLKDSVAYAHKKGIVLKGDLPIGVYRYGCDAWMSPELFEGHKQIGAPPDDFAVKGQNWGFPAYNWKRMQEDDFAWWKKRFSQMSQYFDAFRIDHILGFFRTWVIPAHAIEGVMGHFEPAIPIHIIEFGENGIWLDHHRYCKPFINDEIVNEFFGELADTVKDTFLLPNDSGGYDLLPEFATQQQVDNFFAQRDANETTKKIRQGLLDLISNVLLFEEEGSDGERFHFRIGMESTTSFKNLIPFVQEKMRALYVNYFYHRQEELWKKEALNKLPQLKAATNMLICGEDLGMVPRCVPEVMKQLGILSLEIQRMPKYPGIEFFHPDHAPYLSVVSPATHDMSTIRSWWEEDQERSQRFFHHMLGQQGAAPAQCEAWINRAIVLQHLYSPAQWCIFQLQDILGMSEKLRRENPAEERINIPANPDHIWNYRMHITLEELIKAKEFNEELKGYVLHSGR